MKVKPILFAFVLVILNLSIQNQIVGGEGSCNSDSSQYNDLVAIQVTGGKRCLTEESRNAVVADIRHNVDNSLLVIHEQRSRICECGYAGAGWKRVAFTSMVVQMLSMVQ